MKKKSVLNFQLHKTVLKNAVKLQTEAGGICGWAYFLLKLCGAQAAHSGSNHNDNAFQARS